MKKESDWFWVQTWQVSKKTKELTPLHYYKIASALSNVDQELSPDLIARIPGHTRILAQLRQKLHLNRLDEVESLLKSTWNLPELQEPLFLGDLQCIQGVLFHKRGHFEKSAEVFANAAETFLKAEDLHRSLRARGNAYICLRHLNQISESEVISFERVVAQSGCHDLHAHILRSRAIEKMLGNEFASALLLCEEALDLYKKDGCPEDLSVAHYLCSMNSFLEGLFEKSRSHFLSASVEDGKALAYRAICEKLFQGRRPTVKAGHPLEKVDWPRNRIRQDSPIARILKVLSSQGPTAPRELARQVWADEIPNELHLNRLAVSIQEIRKTTPVLFDGENYRLA